MLWNDIYITATASWLPERVSVEDALSAGQYASEDAERHDHLSVTVTDPSDNVADLWTRAGQAAIARSGSTRDGIDLLLCTATFGAGIDGWNAAAYVQRQIAADGCLATELRGASNGSLLAMELAAAYLTAHTAPTTAVITAGDLFPMPYFDRWRADRILFGDGAAAAVLSNRDGFARIVAMATHSDATLEGLHRADEPIGPFNPEVKYPIDLRSRSRWFQETTMAKEEIRRRMDIGLVTAARQAVEESGIPLDRIDHVVVPHLGKRLIHSQVLAPLGITTLDRSTWEFSRRIGHLGPADQLAGLDHLADSGALRPGQHVLLIGLGAGYTWSCAVLEITSDPAWPTTHHGHAGS
ncbi:ketoacyl-ACP synthase III family protein [Streptomyces olivoreticuli]|uniref:ketoacyl-ACP synthase III family protein n=1 Tax=Streptomyces olivoreticuli TaxID=68246 RepID=UPI000E2326FF|nr:ketoacyl-ACP synthase III family protein [Streptomyces olivoreticuli]